MSEPKQVRCRNCNEWVAWVDDGNGYLRSCEVEPILVRRGFALGDVVEVLVEGRGYAQGVVVDAWAANVVAGHRAHFCGGVKRKAASREKPTLNVGRARR